MSLALATLAPLSLLGIGFFFGVLSYAFVSLLLDAATLSIAAREPRA